MEYIVKDTSSSRGSGSVVMGDLDEDGYRRLMKNLFIKYASFAVAFVHFCGGLCVFAVGIWILKSEDIWAEILKSKIINHGAILLIVTAGVLVIVAVVAMVATAREIKPAIIACIVMWGILFCTFVVAGILGAVANTNYPEELRWRMRDLIQNKYGIDRTVTDIFDHLQENRECCSIEDDSWGVYRNSRWFDTQPGLEEANRPLVPITCCRRNQHGNYEDADLCQNNRRGPPYIVSSETNKALMTRGCFGVIMGFLKMKGGNLAGLGFGSAIVMIPAIVLAIYLLILWRRAERMS